MKNILTLFRVGFLNAWSSSGRANGKRRNRAVKATSVLLYGLLIMALMGFYAYSLAQLFTLGGDPLTLCLVGVALGALLALIFGLAKTSSVLFASRDFELLMALPLSAREIFLSKLLIVYGFSFTGFACAALPFSLVYAFLFPISAGFVPALIVALIFVPMLLATISGLVALLISWIARHFRSTNGAMLVFSVLAFAGYMALVFSFSFTAGSSDAGMLGLLDSFNSALRSFFLTGYLASALEGSAISLVYLALCGLLPFALFALLCAKIYRKINVALREKKMKGNFAKEGIRHARTKGVFSALFGRELRAFFSRYMYVLNCLSGLIMLLLFSGLLVFFGPKLLSEIAETPEFTFDMNLLGLPIFAAIGLWCVGLAPTTTATISLEGKNLWILKTLPVSHNTIFRAKLYVQLVISLPFIAIAAVAYGLVLSPGIVDLVCLILLLLCADLFFAVFGLALNLRFPNVDWVNPNDVLKRSAPVVVCMIVDFVLVIGAGVLYYFLTPPFALFAGVMAAVFLMCAVLVRAWLNKGGVRRFMAL